MPLPSPPCDTRPNLFGLGPAQLADALRDLTPRAFHAAQIHHWMHGRLATGFEAMTDLPAALRGALAERFRIAWPRPRLTGTSRDGSRKYVLALEDGLEVEAVHMVHEDRVTFCLSSQVGCALDCAFCLTGTMGLRRQLSAGEIAGQAAALLAAAPVERDRLRIVFMGMGEPLHNYDAVLDAFRLLVDARGFGLAPRRVTLSTAGLVPGIARLGGENPRPRLAVSLAGPNDAIRGRLMPINRKWNLEALMAACRAFPLGPREKITFEYVLLQGINDARPHAAEIARRLHGIRGKVNVIPYNEAGLEGFRTPAAEAAAAFRDELLKHGVPASIRWSKGRDIGAACGQLVTAAAAV
jgi:23S rRNA (adenine2503-C2)-methyltransferase